MSSQELPFDPDSSDGSEGHADWSPETPYRGYAHVNDVYYREEDYISEAVRPALDVSEDETEIDPAVNVHEAFNRGGRNN